jgi:hypothetical protein
MIVYVFTNSFIERPKGITMTKPFPHPAPGTHIKVDRGFYWHHGIYLGNSKVAHLSKGWNGGQVEIVSLATFAKNSPVQVVSHRCQLPPDLVIQNIERASGRRYSLLTYNCEHFATDCVTMNPHSQQIESAFTALAIGALIGIALAG